MKKLFVLFLVLFATCGFGISQNISNSAVEFSWDATNYSLASLNYPQPVNSNLACTYIYADDEGLHITGEFYGALELNSGSFSVCNVDFGYCLSSPDFVQYNGIDLYYAETFIPWDQVLFTSNNTALIEIIGTACELNSNNVVHYNINFTVTKH